MNSTATRESFPSVDTLYVSALHVTPTMVGEWDFVENDDHEYVEATRYDFEGHELILAVSGGRVRGIVIDGIEYAQYERDTYEDVYADDETGEAPLSDEDWETIFDLDMYDKCEGPMMNYWYELDVTPDGQLAALIVDLPLCIVDIDGTVGLALTGGGMDLTWEICEAFMRLGSLPPYHFATSLPAMGDRGRSERDRWIIAGCLRTIAVMRDDATDRYERLTASAMRWIAGDVR